MVVVVESLLPKPTSGVATDKSKASIGNDMIMLIANPSGKERTIKEYNVSAREAGFSTLKIVYSVSTFWVMEFYKNI